MRETVRKAEIARTAVDEAWDLLKPGVNRARGRRQTGLCICDGAAVLPQEPPVSAGLQVSGLAC